MTPYGRREDAVQDVGQDERVSVAVAAELLGTSNDAVRKRISRGTLRADKDPDGNLYVYIPPSETAASGASQAAGNVPLHLITELRAHNETLRQQLEAERQAHSEARRIIAGLVERIPPALEPPAGEPPGAPAEATPPPGRVEPQPAVESAQEPAEPRSW